MSAGAARGIPFHCPYCGDEDLRPSEEGHGAWECHSCLRVFSLTMLGMVARPTRTASPTRTSAPRPDTELS